MFARSDEVDFAARLAAALRLVDPGDGKGRAQGLGEGPHVLPLEDLAHEGPARPQHRPGDRERGLAEAKRARGVDPAAAGRGGRKIAQHRIEAAAEERGRVGGDRQDVGRDRARLRRKRHRDQGEVHAHHRPPRADRLRRVEHPRPRRAAEVEDRVAGAQHGKALLDLRELVDRARGVPLPAGPPRIVVFPAVRRRVQPLPHGLRVRSPRLAEKCSKTGYICPRRKESQFRKAAPRPPRPNPPRGFRPLPAPAGVSGCRAGGGSA